MRFCLYVAWNCDISLIYTKLVPSVKKLRKGYEDGSEQARTAALSQFDASLVELINFAETVATIEQALRIAFEGVGVKL